MLFHRQPIIYQLESSFDIFVFVAGAPNQFQELAKVKPRLPGLADNAIVNDVQSLFDLTRREPATKARWFEMVFASGHLRLTALRLVFLFVAIALVFAGCCTTPAPHQFSNATEPKAKWHSIAMTPRTNLPSIHFYDKLNPVWWLGNADEPRAPDWYRTNTRTRNFTWYLRNPFSNFSNYVIGIADRKSVRSGKYPTQISNPHGGWNFAVSRRHILYLPFIDYKHGRFEFYFGWRERGNFGTKLNFKQKLPGPHPQNDLASAPAVPPQSDDKPTSSTDLKTGPTP